MTIKEVTHAGGKRVEVEIEAEGCAPITLIIEVEENQTHEAIVTRVIDEAGWIDEHRIFLNK